MSPLTAAAASALRLWTVLCGGSRSIVPKGLARDVVGDAVDMGHFGNDAFADAAEDRIGDLRPLGRHGVGRFHF